MRHVLSALVQNQPGVLAHIAGMLASRAFNIDSLAVGETEVPDLSRMTFVVHGDDATLDQVRKQLDKLVTVVKVQDISAKDIMIEISGQERKIEAFIELMRPYGIVELARTGRIALVRGTPGPGDV